MMIIIILKKNPEKLKKRKYKKLCKILSEAFTKSSTGFILINFNSDQKIINVLNSIHPVLNVRR